ncbi:NAD-dependent protein deacetylase hst1 [Naviculisporaceae sp. PSN 640]
MEPKSRKGSPKERNSTATNDPPATRKPSTRVKGVINYDEKHAFKDLKELDHAVDDRATNDPQEQGSDAEDSWETDSFLEEAIIEFTEEDFVDGPDACTPEESVNYRQLLRSVGPKEFVKRTIDAGIITTKKLLTAFNVRPPDFFEGLADEEYFPLLSVAISRELSKRVKLQKYNTIDDVVGLLHKSKNIIVLTGAGISTSLGIPDFRSKGTGLYAQYAHLGLNDPQEIFDIELFKQDPHVFYTVARDVIVQTDRFSPTHAFIALLQQKGKLLTNYSQNIDNIEEKAGILPEKLVQCHGSFATATCIKCKYQVKGDVIFPDIKAGRIPRCTKCAEGRNLPKKGRKRKLNKDGTERKARRRPGDFDSNSDSEFDVPIEACGVMKPDITFFGEPLPDEFGKRLTEHDRDLVDLVIVIGTSLKVAPVSEVVPFLPPNIPQIYISRTPVSHVNFDVDLLGDCDIVVAELCRRAGWALDHEMIPKDQVVDVTTADGYQSRHVFVQTHPSPSAAPSPATSGPASRSSSESERDPKAERDKRAASRSNSRKGSAGLEGTGK